jgi:hypothetical protein
MKLKTVSRTRSVAVLPHSGLAGTRTKCAAWRLSLGCMALLGAVPPLSAQSVPMGTAAGYGVIAGSAITNTGPTVIGGDLGIWPGNVSSVTGFPPGIVIGTTHFGDAVALSAQNDVTTAYDDVAGRSCGTTISADLGGLTLVPGVYCSASSMGLTGTLTLDAQGDPDAVFIFQVGSALTTASNSSVSVINAGQECNVFWQIGTSATLGTGTAFSGTVLALSSITLTTGASVDGRILARNGAVTLDDNAVNVCTLGGGGPGPATARSVPATSAWSLAMLAALMLALTWAIIRRAD